MMKKMDNEPQEEKEKLHNRTEFSQGYSHSESEKKQYEQNLKESEEKYRRLFETMSLGVVYQLFDGSIISANPAAERMIGITMDQMQGKTSIDPRWKMIREDGSFVLGLEHPSMVALRTGKKTGPVTRGVFIPEKDDYVWLSITAIPLFRKGEDKPYQVYGLFDDITERKQAEEKLRENEKKSRTLFNQSVAGIYLHDLEGRILDVNQEACLQLGYSRDELLKMRVFELHPNRPETVNLTKDEVLPHWNQWESQQRFSMEAAHLHKDGTIIPIQVSTGIVFEEDKKQILAITQDITERKRAEDALIVRKEQLETLSNNIPDGFVYQLTVDPQGNRKFSYVSAGVERVHGVTQAEVFNYSQILYDQIIEGDRQKMIEAEEKAFINLDPFSFEARIRKPSGEIRWVHYQSALSKKLDGTIVADGIGIDITELKEAEEKLHEYASLLELKNQELDMVAQEAQKANQAKSRYLAHMNHEIRTPLNGLLGFLQLMETTNMDDFQQEYMEYMKQSTSHLLNIINNVLDMAKIEAGEIQLSNQIFNLREEIQTALAPLHSLARQKNIHFEIIMNKNLPHQVEGDPDRLRQIALNLGGNAVKFTQEGQVHIAIRCLETTEKQHTLQLLVEDTGSGMTRETLDKIFLPFYQADDGLTPQSKGTGLGMTITRELVELMDGKIQVDSTPGKGTRIEVRLMLGKATDSDKDGSN